MNRPYRILVADDDPDILDLVVLNLAVEGFEVLTATDGRAAEEMARAEQPDAIVLDVMMPEQDGLEVLAALKASPETRGIPVVLLTAKSTDTDVWNGWNTGTDYYMTKPFCPEELVRYVSYLVAGDYATAS